MALSTILRTTLLLAAHLRIGDCHYGHTPATDCTSEFCEIHLSEDLHKRYKITVPEGNTDSGCPDCKITVQLELHGYSWIGFGVTRDGGMVGSHVVIGEPGLSEPKAFYLNGKTQSMITSSDILLEDATIDFINGQTVMEFTTTFESLGVEAPIDVEPAGINLYGESLFIWAHGKNGENAMKYHGSNKASYSINNLSSGTSEEAEASAMTMSASIINSKSKWLAHGILAFIAWGICAPAAISAAILKDFDGSAWFNTNFSEQVSKWWFYAHVGCNTLNYFFTLVVFSLAVSTIKKEGSPNWFHSHSKMGLAMFLLASFQVAGGLFRPSKEVESVKTKKRQVWELAHNISGLMLFLFGVWQMYAGMVLYKSRYDNSNFIAVAVFYIFWMGMWTALIAGVTVYKWKSRQVEEKSADETKHLEEDESAMENEKQLEMTPNDSTDAQASGKEAEVTDEASDKETASVFI